MVIKTVNKKKQLCDVKMICTPNLGQINLRFGMFFMRFSKEDKINMYHMYQKGYRYSEIKGYYPIGKKFLLFGSNIKSLWHRMA